jgi:hypothetical protein
MDAAEALEQAKKRGLLKETIDEECDVRKTN